LGLEDLHLYGICHDLWGIYLRLAKIKPLYPWGYVFLYSYSTTIPFKFY
jgi:hypothetical protein